MSRASILMLIFLALLLCLNIAASAKPRTTEPPKVRSRFKSARCSADNVTVVIKHCYLKAYSKYLVTANFAVDILVPFYKVFVQFIVSYRYGLIFRPVIDTKPQDWCAIMKGGPTNPYIKLVLKDIQDTLGTKAVHECPYVGEFEAYNLSSSYDRINPTSIFPQGVYRITVKVFRDQSEAFTMEVEEEVKSPIRESFG